MTDDSVKRKILALMAKTTENGCTEEEALASSKKVQELLHAHQLDLSDLEIQNSKCTQAEYDTQMKGVVMTQHVVAAIGHFTDTKVWLQKTKYGTIGYQFFGLEHDVLIAEYILKVCDWAIIWGGEDFKDTDQWNFAPKNKRGRLKEDFQYGMARRLSTRIREMKDRQKRNDIASTGRDLVVVKSAVVEDEFAKLGLNLGNERRSNRQVDGEAYAKGQAAGNDVALNPGVNDGSSPSGYIS